MNNIIESTTKVTKLLPSNDELQFETKHATDDHEDIFESADKASLKQITTSTFTTVFNSVIANRIGNTCVVTLFFWDLNC